MDGDPRKGGEIPERRGAEIQERGWGTEIPERGEISERRGRRSKRGGGMEIPERGEDPREEGSGDPREGVGDGDPRGGGDPREEGGDGDPGEEGRGEGVTVSWGQTRSTDLRQPSSDTTAISNYAIGLAKLFNESVFVGAQSEFRSRVKVNMAVLGFPS